MSDSTYRVAELQERGWLLVEDGNHGEYRPRTNEFGTGQWLFIRAADLDGGTVLFEQAERISDAARARIRKGIGAPGDVLFSHKGTVGKVALVPMLAPPFVCSPQTTFWRTLDERQIDRRFLYYFLCSPEFADQWAARKDETDMAAYVSLTAQRELFVRLPDIDDQRPIAVILGTLDDRIGLNRRISHTLEQLSFALFRSWFVDFDPVLAKRDGRKLGALPDAARPCFPAVFEDSELGPLPQGWSASAIGREFRVVMGQSPPGSTYNEVGDGLPFYQGRTDFTFRYPVRRVYCTAPTRFAERGDTLVSVRAPVGDTNIAAEHCAIGRGLAAVRHNSGSEAFTYYAMRALKDEFAVFEAEGTLFGAIGSDDFRRLPFVAPPSPVLEAFDALTGPLHDTIAARQRESATLARLRDALLPALLSGEINPKQAEKLLQGAI